MAALAVVPYLDVLDAVDLAVRAVDDPRIRVDTVLA
jgi:hypothetical protein